MSAVGTGILDAALAGPAAAHQWGLSANALRPPAEVEVLVPHERRVRAPEGVLLRRTRHFESRVRFDQWPPITDPTTTVLDCAGRGDVDEALGWVTRAVQRGRATPAALTAGLAGRRHRHGALLRELLGDVEGVESPAEVRYLRDVERPHGLPRGTRQVVRAGARHDVEYDQFSTVVEIDGRLDHEQWTDRVRDGRRDRSAAGSGAFTTRVFWPDLLDPCRTAAELALVLRARGWSGWPVACRRDGCTVRDLVRDLAGSMAAGL